MTRVKGNMLRNGFLVSAIFLLSIFSQAQDFKVVVDLEGEWKFSIGDDPARAAADFRDNDWDIINVPGSWENNGYTDYNGFAWYRKEFYVPENMGSINPLLLLGKIDDVDEVYINGQLVAASGVMPPSVVTAFELQRRYWVPDNIFNQHEKNVIAIRVFDDWGEGGIVAGPVGFFTDDNNRLLALNLEGLWDFETFLGKKSSKHVLFQDEGKIYVPGYWENFGYPNLDGKATYSRTFNLPLNFDERNIMIVLGYIDDLDEVYINGARIGEREQMSMNYDAVRYKDNIFRAYKIPAGTLKPGMENYIEVTVTDTGGLGGIYEGPVGLISARNFELLKSPKKNNTWNIWDNFLKDFFE
ncbi:MAG: hypothetical protein K9H16_12140 [Bacteroidales bacterium]|nr:hypothetical protein [Bacteroidales bacterium]